jgi:hypothetical protein
LARFEREAQVLATLNHPNLRGHSRTERSPVVCGSGR